MSEYDVTTTGELHQSLPEGEESDWIEFASLPIVSGKLRISDPMFVHDLPPPPTFDVDCGTYRVMAKTMTYPGDKRVSRLRAILREPATFGDRIDKVGVDFAQVGVCDSGILDDAGTKMDDAEGERLVAELGEVRDFGVVQFGSDPRAIMPLASSGFGDGSYPIHELMLDGKRVGVEIVFIGPEVLAD